MSACPSCGAEVADGARFCSNCGAQQPERAAAPPVEERRFVTILFVDLVGFTERSDLADPEDVRTSLVPYHARAKAIIERYGGTLDKFIGDAVMGVFGAPVAHEDDPARAVHAGLRILDAIDELRADDPALQVRVAVNSGEAVVTAGTGPQVGEAVAGDVVNTASRMQALAPAGGLVIGEVTERLVRELFDTEALPPATVKGKAEPLQVWRVISERPMASRVAVAADFVGRDRELALLAEGYEQTVRRGQAQVVTVVGEPGIGKSRLLEEFRRSLGSNGSGPTWHEGRCPSYGEVSAFEPVAMMLREASGCTPADDPADVRAKLHALVRPGAADPDRLVSRLAAILGLLDVAGVAGDPGETMRVAEFADAFTSAIVPDDRPVVLAVQDLHWAEDVMLEFLHHLVRLIRERPVLLLATARPDLSERGGWPPAEGSTTVRLPPLAPEETSRLMRSLLVDSALRTSADASVLARSGGNPLYAVEFARMLIDRGAVGGAGVGEMAVPDTVRSVVAARIDAIPQHLRSLTQVASVAGVEFWPPLIARLHDAPEADVDGGLRDLVARDVIRETRSSLAGRAAFGFAHDLIREVAYARLPRRHRARLHLEVADWLEAETGERADERAEVLAGHLFDAVEYARASRQADIVDAARERAIRWLLVAADRAFRVDVAGAFELYERAAGLEPDDPMDRVSALVGGGRAGRRSARLSSPEVLARFEAALAIVRAERDDLATARVLTRIASQLGVVGDTTRARDALHEAIELLERQEPSHELATAYAYRAEMALFAGKPEDALVDAERSLSVLGADATDPIAVMALHIRGDARCSRGDRGGLDDLEHAVRISERAGNVDDVITSESYVSDWLWAYDGPEAARPHLETSIELAERAGVVSQGGWAKAQSLFLLYELGLWDDVLARADELLAVGRDRLDAALWLTTEAHRAKVLLARGLTEGLPNREELLAEAAGSEDDLQAMNPVLLASARLALADGAAAEAADHMRRFELLTRDAASEFREASLAEAVELAVAAGALDVAESLIAASEGVIPHHRCNLLSARAELLEAKGELSEAADAWAQAADAWGAFGVERQAEVARRGVGRCAGR